EQRSHLAAPSGATSPWNAHSLDCDGIPRNLDGASMTTLTSAAERTQRLLDLTARLADDFATRADEHDRDNTFPFENFDALKDACYTALPIAEELGGLGGTLLDLCLCQERLAQGDASTALAVN